VSSYDWFPGLGAKIGSGVDGEVFATANPNEVVKFSPKFDLTPLVEVASGFHPHFVKVEDFGVSPDGETCFVVMERLEPLTEDEERLFHSLVSHEDKNITKPVLSPMQLEVVLDGLLVGLFFKKGKVKEFYQRVVLGNLTHKDLAPRNIMKTKGGDYKLIDLDRLTHKETI
jgi:serine/threonine protein kinase